MAVTVMRGAVAESRHTVHVAVVREDGSLVASAGDPQRLTTMRSAAKPFQLQPLVELGGCDEWDDELVAVCCASHDGLPEHVAAVRRGFVQCGLDPERLRNRSGTLEERLAHNCSGNHLGHLAHAAATGAPLEGYRELGHPSQRAALAAVADAARVDPLRIETCIDGCGVVAFALPLATIAAMYARIAAWLPRQAGAMRARPEMVRGPGGLDTELMRHLPGCVTKCGAEAVQGVCLAEQGLGVAVRVEDGAFRALDPAVIDVLGQLLGPAGVPDGLEPFRVPAVENASGRVVGEVRSHVRLEAH
jgi:L-asparaginase II